MIEKIPASYAQMEEITEYHLNGGPLIILDSEKARIAQVIRQKVGAHRIVGADLDIADGVWSVEYAVR